jgi:hypothetical protein
MIRLLEKDLNEVSKNNPYQKYFALAALKE